MTKRVNSSKTKIEEETRNLKVKVIQAFFWLILRSHTDSDWFRSAVFVSKSLSFFSNSLSRLAKGSLRFSRQSRFSDLRGRSVANAWIVHMPYRMIYSSFVFFSSKKITALRDDPYLEQVHPPLCCHTFCGWTGEGPGASASTGAATSRGWKTEKNLSITYDKLIFSPIFKQDQQMNLPDSWV